VVKSLEDTGSQVDFEAKEKFAKTIEEDLKRLGEVIKKANLVEK
jgi:tripartite-type tricarboxylate transporter receptor subunit TctC